MPHPARVQGGVAPPAGAIDEQEAIMDGMERAAKFLQEAKTYYLATVDGDQPRVRPFGTAHIFEGKLYIQTGKVKDVAKQLKANPKVELCCFNKGKWIRITGEAVLDEDIEAQKHMLDAYPSLQANYQPGDGNTEVYYIQNATATISSFSDESRTVTW